MFGFGLAFVLAAAPVCEARLLFNKLQKKIDNNPVEIFVFAEDGKPPLLSWIALPAGSYPMGGMSIPELSERYKTETAVNANFYKEDRPGYQEAIGLVLHDGQLYSLPNKFYPSVGIIDGKLQWDELKAKITIEADTGESKRGFDVCRFNAAPSKGCATLWLGKVPTELKNAMTVERKTVSPALGLSTHRRGEGWTIQWHPADFSEREIRNLPRIDLRVSLSGKRLGDAWQSAREAVSGSHILTPGKVFPNVQRGWAKALQPRTLVGADAAGRPWVAVFDGRREQSRGISIQSAWNFVHANLGAAWAVNLDGGGSTTLFHSGHLFNHPSDGYPRAIAVGWGAVPQR